MEHYWDQLFLGNTIRDWGISLAIITGGFLILRIVRLIVLRKLQIWTQRTTNAFDDFLIDVFKRCAMPLFYLGVVNAGLSYLTLSAKAAKIIHAASLAVIIFFIIRLISNLLGYAFQRFAGHAVNDPAQAKQAKGILLMLNVVLWVIGLIFFVDNLGYNITTIIAGLGIGGIAIALAAQTILGDLFSYLVIFFDKPFETGDFIIVGSHSGVVEYIGIKTTRLRALTGEQLVVSNTDLTNSRVQNFKRMERRRVLFHIGVTYETGSAKLHQIPGLIKQIITQKPNAQFDRVHFSGFGDFSLQFEIVYYMLTADYLEYMNTQQEVLLEIYEAFEREKIEFAYPTQKLFWEKTVPAPSSETVKKTTLS
jgi:small-conductance mechanosensitive channel